MVVLALVALACGPSFETSILQTGVEISRPDRRLQLARTIGEFA